MSQPRSAIPVNPDPEIFKLPGPQAMRRLVWPAQRLQLQDAAKFMNVSYITVYRRSLRGTLGLEVWTDPHTGKRYVMVEDLIRYLYPGETAGEARLVIPNPGKKKRGRPRSPVKSGVF